MICILDKPLCMLQTLRWHLKSQGILLLPGPREASLFLRCAKGKSTKQQTSISNSIYCTFAALELDLATGLCHKLDLCLCAKPTHRCAGDMCCCCWAFLSLGHCRTSNWWWRFAFWCKSCLFLQSEAFWGRFLSAQGPQFCSAGYIWQKALTSL